MKLGLRAVTPEEGETQEVEDVPATPKDSLNGPIDEAVLPTELLFLFFLLECMG
ncbi:hypothetical protein FRX31_012252, partial [Thalictrum thalictroides]